MFTNIKITNSTQLLSLWATNLCKAVIIFTVGQRKLKINQIINPFFSFVSLLHVMIVKKGYSVQSSAIFWVNFVLTSKNNTWRRKERKLFLSVCACFAFEWKTQTMSQSKLDPFFCIVVHRPKKHPTSLLWKGITSEGKIQGQKLFLQSNQGSSKSLFMWKKCWRLVALKKQTRLKWYNLL